MTVQLSPVFNGFQGFSIGGLPLAGGLINTYLAGTSTPAATYTDATGLTANANPIQLDGAGLPPNEIWLAAGTKYKFVVTDSLGLSPRTYDNIPGIGDAYLASFSASSGSSLIGFLQAGTGAVARTMQAKGRDAVSVADFGAVGDGVTDDTTAVQAAALYARTNGRVLFWPTPSSFYRVTSPISMGSSAHWVGENGSATILRNTGGAGASVVTCDGTGSLGPYCIEHLRIGGAGSVGLTVTGGGFAQYVANLDMYDVHFEADLLTCVSANMIYHHAVNCSFGYYQQSSINASHQHYIVTGGTGGLNANVNRWSYCRFYNSPASFGSIIQSGIICEFDTCDWEANVRNLKTNNVTSLLLKNCYTERATAGNLTGAFELDNTQTTARVLGGEYLGGNLVSGASMFSIDGVSYFTCEDARITNSASAFVYYNNSAVSHAPPTTGIHRFRNNIIAGNSSDPLFFLSGIVEDGANTWTPAPTNLTVVNGTGGASYTGRWAIRNRQVHFEIRIVVTGTCTTAATATTFFGPMSSAVTGFPLPQHNATLSVAGEDGTSLGNGYVDYSTGRFWMPTWSAKNADIVISGSYLI